MKNKATKNKLKLVVDNTKKNIDINSKIDINYFNTFSKVTFEHLHPKVTLADLHRLE
jgi:hypothetical protein